MLHVSLWESLPSILCSILSSIVLLSLSLCFQWFASWLTLSDFYFSTFSSAIFSHTFLSYLITCLLYLLYALLQLPPLFPGSSIPYLLLTSIPPGNTAPVARSHPAPERSRSSLPWPWTRNPHEEHGAVLVAAKKKGLSALRRLLVNCILKPKKVSNPWSSDLPTFSRHSPKPGFQNNCFPTSTSAPPPAPAASRHFRPSHVHLRWGHRSFSAPRRRVVLEVWRLLSWAKKTSFKENALQKRGRKQGIPCCLCS